MVTKYLNSFKMASLWHREDLSPRSGIVHTDGACVKRVVLKQQLLLIMIYCQVLFYIKASLAPEKQRRGSCKEIDSIPNTAVNLNQSDRSVRILSNYEPSNPRTVSFHGMIEDGQLLFSVMHFKRASQLASQRERETWVWFYLNIQWIFFTLTADPVIICTAITGFRTWTIYQKTHFWWKFLPNPVI